MNIPSVGFIVPIEVAKELEIELGDEVELYMERTDVKGEKNVNIPAEEG